MKVKHGIALAPAILFAGMALTCLYAAAQSPTIKPPAAIKNQSAIPPLMTTALPVMRSFKVRVAWIGTVESRSTVRLTALIAGRVEAIAAEDQTRIEKGRPVMRLGGPLVEEQRGKLGSEVKSLKSRLDLARQTVKRLTQSLQEQLATKDQVSAARNTQIQLEAQLREARLNLKTFDRQIHIQAPMNGIFTHRRVSVGQDVNAGQVIGEIIDPDHLRIVVSIFPPPGINLQDKEATVRLDGTRTVTGIVRRVLPRAGDTGAVRAWLEGVQIDQNLRPGRTVGGSLVVEIRPETPAVPESAVVYDQDEHPFLFVRAGKTYQQRRVRLGLAQEGWVEVLSGLEQDQTVVTQGAYELFYRQFNEQFKVRD